MERALYEGVDAGVAFFLEVMVQGRHFEYTAAACMFEICYLDYYREVFDIEERA